MNLTWKTSQNRYRFQLGRQFLFAGVMNGTVDGFLVSATLTKHLELKLVGGLDAPPLRKMELLKWDEGNVFGGYLAYHFPGQTRVDLSYYQKARNQQTVWQQLGMAVNGKLMPELYYQAHLDFNLLASSIQTLRGRLIYYHQKWSLSTEFNSQAPRIYEDSYFKVFELSAANQIRTGVTYQLKPVQLGLQYLLTMAEGGSNNQMLLTVGSNWGLVGLIFQNGFGGDNLGVYGEVQYPIIKNLTLRLYSSYYNYQRHTIDISEDATAFSGGLQYRLGNSLQIRADLQESTNTYFKNDLRGLFRLNYFFNN